MIEVRPTRVALSIADFGLALGVGDARHDDALARGNADAHGRARGESGRDIHRLGALGEVAAARALGIEWPARVGNYKGADLLDWIDVKARSNPRWDLIVRDDDRDDFAFVLATGALDDLEWLVWGWATGAEARRPEWRKDHGGREPAFFVPKPALRPLAALRVEIRERETKTLDNRPLVGYKRTEARRTTA